MIGILPHRFLRPGRSAVGIAAVEITERTRKRKKAGGTRKPWVPHGRSLPVWDSHSPRGGLTHLAHTSCACVGYPQISSPSVWRYAVC